MLLASLPTAEALQSKPKCPSATNCYVAFLGPMTLLAQADLGPVNSDHASVARANQLGSINITVLNEAFTNESVAIQAAQVPRVEWPNGSTMRLDVPSNGSAVGNFGIHILPNSPRENITLNFFANSVYGDAALPLKVDIFPENAVPFAGGATLTFVAIAVALLDRPRLQVERLGCCGRTCTDTGPRPPRRLVDD
jgi:hypothetical protein